MKFRSDIQIQLKNKPFKVVDEGKRYRGNLIPSLRAQEEGI